MPMQKSGIKYPKRGEIYIANLDPAFGREIHKKRPVLIISLNNLNQILPTVIMIPFSSIVLKDMGPDLVDFKNQKGLNKDSTLVVNQLGAIDKVRLLKKIGKISKNKMQEVEEAVKLVLGLNL